MGVTILTLYAVVLLATPALHHDFECHARTPAHCQACVASSPATPTVILPAVASGPLPVVGEVTPTAPDSFSAPFRLALPGRAPPA
jgi:hypothetical protein